jgi:hypothetical protein
VSLKIADVLKQDVRRFSSLEYIQHIVKDRSSSLILETPLAPGLRERLARKARAQDVVGRDLVLRGPDVTKDSALRVLEILGVQAAKFGIDFGCEYAFVP